jgi:hypothetical protein
LLLIYRLMFNALLKLEFANRNWYESIALQ